MNPRSAILAVMVVTSLFTVTGCSQSAPPLSESAFKDIARRCGLSQTSYRRTHSMFLESAMIDFSREPDPAASHKCFSAKMVQISLESAVASNSGEGVSYIWDTRE